MQPIFIMTPSMMMMMNPKLKISRYDIRLIYYHGNYKQHVQALRFIFYSSVAFCFQNKLSFSLYFTASLCFYFCL